METSLLCTGYRNEVILYKGFLWANNLVLYFWIIDLSNLLCHFKKAFTNWKAVSIRVKWFLHLSRQVDQYLAEKQTNEQNTQERSHISHLCLWKAKMQNSNLWHQNRFSYLQPISQTTDIYKTSSMVIIDYSITRLVVWSIGMLSCWTHE